MTSRLFRSTPETTGPRHLINLTALVTPFDNQGEIDKVALTGLLERMIVTDQTGVVIGGTTGETATLTAGERHDLLRTVISFRDAHAEAEGQTKRGHGPFEVVYGWGGNSTRALLDELDRLDLDGVSALLSVTPYYNKPTQEGLYQHYKTLADHAPLPLILYNVPSRTGVNLLPETVGRLASHDNIVGLKEAYTDPGQLTMTLAAVRQENFYVLSGDDMLTPGLITMGGHGCIGVMGNLFPGAWAGMFEALQGGTFGDYLTTWDELARVNDLLYREGNPVGVKAALAHLRLCRADVRLPLASASGGLRETIGRVLDSLTITSQEK